MFNQLFFKLSLAALLLSASAQAILPIPTRRQKQAQPIDEFTFGLDLRYQIGTEWGKKPVSLDSIKDESEQFQRAAMATARVGGATGFYLGLYNGKHIMATNHHVMPGKNSCTNRSVRFPLLDITLRCEEFLGDWTDVDLALFVLSTPTAEEAAALYKVAKNFAFDHDLEKGEELITIGFGVADNPERNLVANQDSDCRVFSQDAEYRFMGDPDDFNPADYKAWSFSNGCDVSHGDSGSAMVSRKTGEPVGIIWTGRIPKDEKVQNADYLVDIYSTNSEDVWKQLSYAVPAKKIGEFLKDLASKPDTDEQLVKTLNALLGR